MNDAIPEILGPLPGEERIPVIDCLRGWALFGILLANMRGFHAPVDVYMRLDYWTWFPDHVAQAAIDWLFSGKFITIFAVLFGVGFAIQMDRALLRGGNLRFYARRMAVLLAIGILHVLLFWWGDILIDYAVCGFLLLSFRNRNQRSLLLTANALYWFMVLMFLGFYLSTVFGTVPPPSGDRPNLQAIIQTYGHGTIRQIFAMRIREWWSINQFVEFLTRVLGFFLMGVYIWRQGYLRAPSAHLSWWKKARLIGLTLGLIGNALSVFLVWHFHVRPDTPNLAAATWVVLESLSVPILSLGYAATIVLLWQDPVWQERLRPFSYVGRMALSNYLLQSLICTTIFYSYGLGLYGRVGPLSDVFVAIAIYGAQIPFSRWWLKSHRYGPMEWLWRRLTYGPLTAVAAVP